MNIKTLLPELKRQVELLSEDLLVRSTSDSQVDAGLREAFTRIEKGGRTAQAHEVWREDYLEQVAVAWVLACVFVRFMEDNRLIDECWLAGEGDRRKAAEDAHELYFRRQPHLTDREYFQHVFHEVGRIPAARDLFAEGKTPLWAVGPSGDAAMRLLTFWREIDAETGRLKRVFSHERHENHEREKFSESRSPLTARDSSHPSSSSSPSSFRDFRAFRGSLSSDDDPTRFLGDLYQDLSERARKKYALLQTPVFVEEFILDRTLDPAIDDFGIDAARMIDPTCGSGHFLLGGFARLFDLWTRREDNAIVAAQKALDGVWGVDINPFAVAIARFRLIVAALAACGIGRLKDAPGWTIHLATGDSLLFGSRWNRTGGKIHEQEWFATDEGSWAPDIYACEDREALQEVLGRQYHAVVGNPPYITVKDPSLNAAYRERYPDVCHRQYSVAVPFTERFFDLALASPNGRCGHVGMITANSFMKREFGKKLIEDFFPKVDLTHVIDTSGAYIPGHGTPTVILFGRNRGPNGDAVRAVLGIKGEPTTPEDASQGLVWQSIVRQIDQAGTEDEFTSTTDVPRTTFAIHPWSIGGGGAADLKDIIESTSDQVLGDIITDLGRSTHTGEDGVFYIEPSSCRTKSLIDFAVPLVEGEGVRDYILSYDLLSLLPYDLVTAEPSDITEGHLEAHFWRFRTSLKQRKDFGQFIEERGLRWFDHSMFFPARYRTPLSIAFAFVATHNHFVLDRGGKVFNRSAPIIKLPADATEEDHLALLGLLNSSTACFWMKQSFHNKGSTVDQHGARQRTDPFEDFYEYTGTGLQRFPIPEQRPVALARLLDRLGRDYSASLPDAIVGEGTAGGCGVTSATGGRPPSIVPTGERLEEGRSRAILLRGRMIALQEELDWECYRLYGLLDDRLDVVGPPPSAVSSSEIETAGVGCPPLALGERAFEIVMARRMARGELETTWFERHGSTPIAEIPSHWPDAYRALVDRRIRAIETNKEIGLIERPEYKRRWNDEPWEAQEQRALKTWLLDRLESPRYWPGVDLRTTARLADVSSGDADFLQVAALYRGRPDFDVTALILELVEAESVPFLPILRYKPSGLRKREVWERTWELQREEDKQEGTTKGTKGTKRETDQDGRTDVSEPDDLANSSSDSSFREFRDFRGSSPPIPVPPKYTSADFLKNDHWRLRGKLDVPKERWISYPHLQTESDPTLVVGWAGWDHLQQASALVAYYEARKREGWDARRLTPILAGLDQLLPWIHQWHPEIDPEFGDTAGQSYQTLLENDAHELGLTLEDIRSWQPPEKTRKARAPRKKKGQAEDDA